jgi:DNA-binding response OmpR family regulator
MSQPLALLLVEDNPADADLIREMLTSSGPVTFDVETASRLSDAVTCVRGRHFDLILLDLGLPDSQGLGTFNALKDAAPGMPIVVLTGNDDQELATRAVRDGAQDYLVKGQIVGHLLVRATLYAMERKRMEEAWRRQTEELRARNEELTRFNRAAVDRELRMVELKQEVNALRSRLGEPPSYTTAMAEGDAAIDPSVEGTR